MPVSKKALVIITVVITLSVLISKLSKLIAVRVDESEGNLSEELGFVNGIAGMPTDRLDSNFKEDKSVSYNERKREAKYSFIVGDTSNHLLWFMQISDLHISAFQDPMRVSDLQQFCNVTIKNIKPVVVLASGDLTDAKTADNMGSSQYLAEWSLYKKVLDDCRVLDKTMWLDIRGNHDNFNVISLNAKANYFRNYSVQGAANPRSYLYQTKHGGETYSFLAVDACLDPGPRRPFNFIGVLTRTEADHVMELAKESLRNGGNYTIWFGHYPTSSMLGPKSGGLSSIIGNHSASLAYLCGHYHTLGGYVPKMYTLQHDGFLELELGDWKDNRKFRVVAIDHGLLSFVDASHNEWPLILVTNPKHALYTMPANEPLKIMNKSTHIRILVFSILDITTVKMRLDDGEWRTCKHVKGPLYVSPWNPMDYNKGLHNVHVSVIDRLGAEKTITQPFSLDGTRLNFPFLARVALMCNISILFQVLFGLVTTVSVVPLCILRYIHHLTKAGRLQKIRFSVEFFQTWFKKLSILSTVDRIFFPLVIYPLYLIVGPWAIGEIIQHHTGAIFAWGTIINWQYLPGSFTYFYGCLQLFGFQWPLVLTLAHSVDQRFEIRVNSTEVGLIGCCICNFFFLVIVLAQSVSAYYFFLAYGTMAFLLGPLRTWSAILAAILWYQSVNLPDKCFRSAVEVWYNAPNAAEDNQDLQNE